MPKSGMGWVKFSLAVGISILALEYTGILAKGRTMMANVS